MMGPSQALMESAADALISTGLHALGYTYVNVDDGECKEVMLVELVVWLPLLHFLAWRPRPDAYRFQFSLLSVILQLLS